MFREIKLIYLVLILSLFNLICFHFPFFEFVLNNVDTNNFNGVLLVSSLVVCSIVANAMVFYLFIYLFRKVGKWLVALLFILNAVALYFVNTYGVIIDHSMMGNVFNTNYDEATSYFSFTFLLYIILLGIVPAIFVIKTKTDRIRIKKFAISIFLTIFFLLSVAYANASNWLWIDKNSKTLGALVMPWSYLVNTGIHFKNKNHENKEQIKLPNATIENKEKAVVVLVIGESARSANFSLYGYNRNTNPLLSKVEGLQVYNAESSATYTTAGVKAILEHKDTNDLYEILPNYLFRNNVDVIWRTSNWGEPKVKIDKYLEAQELAKNCEGADCDYDGILISNIKEQISQSNKDKVFIVLHTSTSHGPTYYKKYPQEFNKFVPVCTSVELAKCTQEELINAYDNTILYTDYILSTLIEELKQLEDWKTTMFFVSDHGESLGEKNLYMHGIPLSIAPKEQYEIPFLVWTSDNSVKFKKENKIGQHHVFHSVLDLLSIKSPVYNSEMSIIQK